MNNFKNFKRVVSFSAAAAIMLAGIKFTPLSNENVLAADTLTAFEITEEMKIGWNVGNSLDATSQLDNPGLSSETAWGNPKISQELIDAVKAKGFNTIRIPTTWYQHLDEENNIDPQWLDRVHEVVDYCYKNDMYIILNLHHEAWVNRSDLGTAYDEMQPKLLKIWQQIADEFTDYDQHLIFECMNEPRAVKTDHEWWGPEQSEVDTINKLNADFVDLIRNDDSPYNDTRLLMIPGYCAASDVSMISKIDVPEDDYVAVSIHAYVPYNFTMNSAVKDHSVFTEAYSTELEGILEGIRKTFIEKDIPVIIGEFGTSNYENTDARIAWATQYLTKTKKIGVPCVLWDNNTITNPKDPGECHGYINRSDLTWYEISEPVVDTMMDIIADDTIVWGSEKQGVQYDHEDIDLGIVLYYDTEGQSIDSSIKDGNCTSNFDITPEDLKGKDIAIKFTGDVPTVAGMDSEWENWTEIAMPYDVDEENGIAYYSGDKFLKMWGDNVIAHLTSRTTGKTTVYQIALINASSADIPDPPVDDKTKKYNLKLKDVDRNGTLKVNFKGTADTMPTGCIGYMLDGLWTQYTWDGVIDKDGTFVLEVPMSEIPESITSAELQIWWGAEVVDMVDYEVIPSSTDVFDGVYGDANDNGTVEIADAVFILQGIADPSNNEYTIKNNDAADCFAPGSGIDAEDALAIQLFIADIIKELPLTVMPASAK